MGSISQLIKDFLRVSLKILKYFNGSSISTSLILLAAGVPVNFTLGLKDYESVIAALSASPDTSL